MNHLKSLPKVHMFALKGHIVVVPSMIEIKQDFHSRIKAYLRFSEFLRSCQIRLLFAGSSFNNSYYHLMIIGLKFMRVGLPYGKIRLVEAAPLDEQLHYYS